jgi:leucyl aminopeptidase
MDSLFTARAAAGAIPIWFVTAANYPDVRQSIGAEASAFADAAGFEPKPGRYLLFPGKLSGKGGAASGAAGSSPLGGVLFGIEGSDETKDAFLPGRLPQLLPDGVYRFANEPHDARLAALAFALGCYRFTRYRKAEARSIKLDLPQSVAREELEHIVEGVTLARDLINTPANDMGPAQLEQAARKLAARHTATITAVVGDELLEQNFPLIHAVGRAAAAAPRLIDISWGDAGHPRVTLVGKGVCFDTGGLDIKPETAMLNMKKDMGGAATALALAHMIMAHGLKLRLRVLIPAVENAIAGSSFRPRDIYTSRKGITVEIGNTDAEGRLILADALALADEDKPALIADFATLTGAARVALGPDVPAFFTDDDRLADDLMRAAKTENDPLWRLPLWRPYESMLESKVADINNVGGSQGGAITAALFMRRFVSAQSWVHFDLFAWTPSAKAGRPEGGECQAARALYALLAARYG